MSSTRKKKTAQNLQSLIFDVNEELQLGNFRDAQCDLNWVPQFNNLQSGYSLQYSQHQDCGVANESSKNYQAEQTVSMDCQQSEVGILNQGLAQQNHYSVLSNDPTPSQVLNETMIRSVDVEKLTKTQKESTAFQPQSNLSACTASSSKSRGKDLKLIQEPDMTLKEKIAFVKSADFSKKIPMQGGPSMLNDRCDKDVDEDDVGSEDDDKENESQNISKLRKCLICNRKYRNDSYFRLHCREIHNLCIGPKRCQKMCALCGRTFSTEESYQDHEQVTKSNLIYCLEKVHALKGSSKANSQKNFRNVSAIDLQLMSQQNKKMKLSE
jgi:hypothetical protein